jgi:hypothetical protein
MEMAGIEMLPPEAGVPWIRRELTEGSARGEVVVAQALGALLAELDANGGLDTSSAEPVAGPLIGVPLKMDVYEGLVIDTQLDPALQPFLYDHRIEGTPVLPGVVGIEAFAEAALLPLPGWRVDAVEDVHFLAPFKFYRDEPRAISLHAKFHPDGDRLIAHCRLTGTRTLANQTEPQLTTHFTGNVRLTRQAPAPVVGANATFSGSIIGASDIYRVYFHGPAYRVIERASWNGHQMIARFAARLPDHHVPADRPLAFAPRLIELCFQTAGLYEMVVQRRMGLPLRVDRVRLFRSPESAEGPLFAVVTPAADFASFDADVVDSAGNLYLCLNGYRTVQFRETVDLQLVQTAEARS